MKGSKVRFALPWQFYIICVAVTAMSLILSLGSSYLLALVDHPVAVWLWRDILGVL